MRYLVLGLFFLVASAILFFVHRYLWRRLVRDTGLRGTLRRVATGLIVLGGLVVPATLLLARQMPRGIVEYTAVWAFTWLGALLYIVLLLVPFDLMAWLRRRRGRAATEAPVEDPSRRQFLARAAAGTALAGTAGSVVLGLSNALGEVSTPTVEVSLPRLPQALDGFRIVQLSDIHIGPILDRRFIHSIVEKTNALKPDLVVITGDLVDGAPDVIGRDVAGLMGLKSRYGTYFVTGNHEYYSDAAAWLKALGDMGIRTLMNERVRIGDKGPGGASFDLCGIPDTRAGRFISSHTPDLKRALQGRDIERESVLLAHRPNPIVDAAQHGIGLQLSGHTHGGQLWPITIAARLVHPYNAGLHRHNDLTQIYVSRGTGFWGPPMRILAPAEITTLVLKAG